MTYKEYIKTISQRSTSYLLDELDSYGPDSYYRPVYNAIMSELKERAMWHKVEDGDLPEFNRRVLVCLQDGYKYGEEKSFITIGSRHQIGESTYEWWVDEGDDQDIVAWTKLPNYTE